MPLLIRPTRRQFLAAAAAIPALAQTKPAHWALLSDTHIFADKTGEYRGFRPYDNLKRVLPQVRAAQPDGVLINGDLAKLEGLTADYELLKSMIEPVAQSMPLCLSLGNHDDRKNFMGVMGKLSRGVTQPVESKHVLVLDQPPVRFIVLDSLMTTNVAAGLLGKTQRTWLQNYFSASDDTPVIIFVHHTMDDGDNSLLDADRLLHLTRGVRKVKAIIYGHSHAYQYDSAYDIHLINIPAVGYNFADSEPVGWVEAMFYPDHGSFQLHAFGGNTKDDRKARMLTWRQ
jgi:3',5'-cyclic-AMP phosphodiesterase